MKARSENVKAEVRERYEEHKQIKSSLAKIASITRTDETYDIKVKVLREDVEHHVQGEETANITVSRRRKPKQ